MLPWASISGLPELPPTMSLLVEMQNGVRMSSRSLTFIQLSGILNGGEPVARSNARSRCVKGSTERPSPIQPFTVP